MYFDQLETVLERMCQGLDNLECGILRAMRRNWTTGLEDALIIVINLNVNANAILDDVYTERDNQWFASQI